MSPTRFEPSIPATAWPLESAKYVINNNKSQKMGADAPARTSHNCEDMKSTYCPLLVLQPWFIVLEQFNFTSRALRHYSLSLYLSNLNCCLCSAWDTCEQKPTSCCKICRSVDHSNRSKDPADLPPRPSCFVIERNKSS
jgi:hypothetical protein